MVTAAGLTQLREDVTPLGLAVIDRSDCSVFNVKLSLRMWKSRHPDFGRSQRLHVFMVFFFPHLAAARHGGGRSQEAFCGGHVTCSMRKRKQKILRQLCQQQHDVINFSLWSFIPETHWVWDQTVPVTFSLIGQKSGSDAIIMWRLIKFVPQKCKRSSFLSSVFGPDNHVLLHFCHQLINHRSPSEAAVGSVGVSEFGAVHVGVCGAETDHWHDVSTLCFRWVFVMRGSAGESS